MASCSISFIHSRLTVKSIGLTAAVALCFVLVFGIDPIAARQIETGNPELIDVALNETWPTNCTDAAIDYCNDHSNLSYVCSCMPSPVHANWTECFECRSGFCAKAISG